MIPSAPPQEEEPEPVCRRASGSKERAKVPPIRVIKGTTADGEDYNIWVMAKDKAKGFAMGAARFGANATLNVGKGLIDFADDVTFDIQGKKAERHRFFAEGNAKGAALNNPLAVMNQVGEDAQATWSWHRAANDIGSRPEYEPREHREDKEINFGRTRIGRAAKGTMSLLGHASR